VQLFRISRKSKMDHLEQENRELRARLEALEAKLHPAPGLEGAHDSWAIQVGGESIELRALSDEQWTMALGELPSFLLEYSISKASHKGGDDAALLKKLYQTAQQWILACAITEVKIQRLTIPEARSALITISHLNGVDAALQEFLQQRLLGNASGPGGNTVRPAPQRSAETN